MKTTGIIICLSLFLGIVSIQTQAQEAPVLPELYLVIEEFVQPADLPAFSDVQQEAIDLGNKSNVEMSVFAYATDASSFYWVIPIKNFASIDKVIATMAEQGEKMKAEGYDPDKKFRDLSTSAKW